MTIPERLTIPKLIERKGEGRRITMVSTYDTPTARLVDEAGIDILLVGDSLAMVVLGRENTLSVTMDEMIHHTRAVARARRRALLVADMPFLSYHISRRQGIRNAGRLVQEAGADAVKVEGGRERAAAIQAIVDAEIPVMGHVGLNPQAVQRLGGFKIQGRTLEHAESILRDAEALQQAGVFALVLEAIPEELGRLITHSVKVPTIGIGAGRHCDGQVLVFHDLIGLEERQKPRFVRRYACLRDPILEALSAFRREVEAGHFPSDEEVYTLRPEVARALASRHGESSQ
ncbi:MAG: 3-methyl-2-oxobutanoate hydroxymethyltransferase [Acidobacteriota bacterium]